MDEIKKVAIIGAGMMGSDIALICAKAGYKVLMKEVNVELAQAGYERIVSSLEKWIAKGKLDIDQNGKSELLERVTPTASYDGFEEADVVIEAIVEDVKAKMYTFQELEEICKASCIIATNTSSISITKLGASFKDNDRKANFLGLHFFSPASIMKLVEVIKGEETSLATMDSACGFCRSIEKDPVRIIDCVGFVVNRILYALQNEAVRIYEEGIASPEDIDKACRLGLGHPVGPFALLDLTSNDLYLKIAKIFCEAYGERCRPRPVMVKKVDAGHLGRKTKKGWYDYR